MKIQTFSIVAGTRACDARCPFCVSKMTGFAELPGSRAIDERNFRKAALLAERAGTTTVLFTGKGEPTLYPEEISEYLRLLQSHSFPLIELQTNALAIGRLARDRDSGTKLTAEHLGEWYSLGLDTIAISAVDVRTEPNREVYAEDYPDLATTVGALHDLGFSVRLCIMMARGFVDSPERLQEVIEFCHEQRVDQLTARPIRRPESSKSAATSDWVARRGMEDAASDAVYRWVADRGTHILSLMHGARVYDVGGQNVCISDCLTVEPEEANIRTLIFYSNGRIAYSWQYEGAVLLGGKKKSSTRTPPTAAR
jgi:pyruvate-formate lyase-activating enzyme